MEALKDLLYDLNDIADSDVDYIQDIRNFHAFDQQRAKDEMAYRKALKDELDAIAKNIQRLDVAP